MTGGHWFEHWNFRGFPQLLQASPGTEARQSTATAFCQILADSPFIFSSSSHFNNTSAVVETSSLHNSSTSHQSSLHNSSTSHQMTNSAPHTTQYFRLATERPDLPQLCLCSRTIWCHSTSEEMRSVGPVHGALQRRDMWQRDAS